MLIGLDDDPWESEQASAWTPEATAALKPKPSIATDLWESLQAAAWTPQATAALKPGVAGKKILGIPLAYAVVALALTGAAYYYTRGRD
jgi:hypothetical protein